MRGGTGRYVGGTGRACGHVSLNKHIDLPCLSPPPEPEPLPEDRSSETGI